MSMEVRARCSKTSAATNKMHYLCTSELMELISFRFTMKIDNERLNQQQVNVLEELDIQEIGMIKLLYCFMAACNRNIMQKLDEHIVDTLVNMLAFNHEALHEQDANGMIRKIKNSLVHT